MMKSSIYKVLDKMNELEKQAERYNDKSYDAYQAGNEKRSEHYDRIAEEISMKISGFEECLKTLGLDAWKDDAGEWNIPLDDIERVC